VFLVNSRLDLFTAAPSASTGKRLQPTGALLIPKLRSNFAEFLNEGYLDHLSILYLPTCVGFGTGTRFLPRGFSWRHGVGDSPALEPAGIAPRVMRPRICQGPPLHAYPRTTIAWDPVAFLVPPSVKRKRRGTGISTCWPSTTPFGLALGPD
jgi:hypothetical protein